MMGIVDDTDGDDRRRLSLGNRDARVGGTDEFVAASWLRSQAAGVSPDGGDIRYIGDVDLASRLIHYTRPILEKLIEYAEDIPLSVAVSDNKGRVLSRLDTNSAIGALVDTISLSPGFSYAESEVGTNGVGTVLESGRSVHIVGAAHFHERFQKYSCSGAPIRDPLSGHIEGVLDLTCLVEHSTPLLHSFVRSAASTIETALLHDRELNQRILFNAFSKMKAKTRVPLLVAGKDVLISTSKAQKIFDADEQRVIVQHALYLAERTSKATEQIELSSQRIVKIRTTRISSGTSVLGVGVAIVDLASSDEMPQAVTSCAINRSGLSNRAPMDSMHSSGSEVRDELSSVWKKAKSIARDAIERNKLVAVIGESGSGRVRLVKEVICQVYPDVYTIEIEPGFDQNDIERKIDSIQTGRTYFLLRYAERLTSDEIASIATVLSDVGSHPGVIGAVAVVAETEDYEAGDSPPHQQILGLFSRSVHVPPLRHRTADLAYLTREILSELAGGGAPKVGRDVIEKLGMYSWPGNITELREVLSKILENRPTEYITVENLPTGIGQLATRASGLLESVEREAIVKSLEENGGNRVRAAKSLGIARSSLYRKMKTYKI